MLGLFTRFFAAAAAIEMLVIFFVYWNVGFSWLRGGYEYALMWGLVSFAIALRAADHIRWIECWAGSSNSEPATDHRLQRLVRKKVVSSDTAIYARRRGNYG